MNDGDVMANDWLRIVKGEYIEMPGLRLTRSQVQRLWGLDHLVCTHVLAALVKENFLRLTEDGRYSRRTTSH